MARAFIPSPLRDLTAGHEEIEVSGTTVRELVAAIERQHPGFAARVTADGELSPALQVSVDGTFSRRGLDARVKSSSEVHFLPVFGGG
jgi:molybdopterin converting factor small subunit